MRGQQYRYKGHVINFLRDTTRVYRRLPLLPANADIVLLRPSTRQDAAVGRQFTKEFTVRRRVIRM